MNCRRLTACVVAALTLPTALRAEDRFSAGDRPPTSSRNRHYPGSREPLAVAPLVKLPVGAVSPRGWLRKQLELQAAGFHGHLGEM